MRVSGSAQPGSRPSRILLHLVCSRCAVVLPSSGHGTSLPSLGRFLPPYPGSPKSVKTWRVHGMLCTVQEES